MFKSSATTIPLVELLNPGKQAHQFRQSTHSRFRQHRLKLSPYGFTRQPICRNGFVNAFALDRSQDGSSFYWTQSKSPLRTSGDGHPNR
jgi:hypothetical protein